MIEADEIRAMDEAAARRSERPRRIDWTVEVEDFGPIQEASITMAPLVILVGKNNTGKSYMATLLNVTNALL